MAVKITLLMIFSQSLVNKLTLEVFVVLTLLWILSIFFVESEAFRCFGKAIEAPLGIIHQLMPFRAFLTFDGCRVT